MKRSFILTLEGNKWQISTIIAYAIPAQAVPDNANGAEAAILNYIQVLQDHQPQTAWSWLRAEAQQQVSQE